MKDGDEDLNANGQIDEVETDPMVASDVFSDGCSSGGGSSAAAATAQRGCC